jgi:hypothetical protein
MQRDAGGELQGAQTKGVELRHAPGGALRHEAAQRPQRPVGAGVQQQAEPVGGGAAARGALGGEVALPGLDVVLGLAAGVGEVLVDCARIAARQGGDDEAGVGALRPGFDAGDDPLDA